MVGKQITILAVVSVIAAVILTGCGASTQLKLGFSPNQSSSYQAVSDTIKDFRFEQPNLNKLREEQTKTHTDMTYTQTIDSVDADGVATANITIDTLKVDIISKNQAKLTFDSNTEEGKKSPLASLLGKSYTITISPAGKVSVTDTKEALSAVKAGYEKKIAQNILSTEAITARHEIPALPKEPAQVLSVGETWSAVVPSPPGLLTPKSYEKTYTMASIEGDVATVTMQAAESGQGTNSEMGGMGMFAKMFDNTDDYTGSLKINTASGSVLAYDETLISTYIAQQMPENGDPEKGPDTLTMRFTHRIQLEKLN